LLTLTLTFIIYLFFAEIIVVMLATSR